MNAGIDNKITNDVFITYVIKVNSDWWCEEEIIWLILILWREASSKFQLQQVVGIGYNAWFLLKNYKVII